MNKVVHILFAVWLIIAGSVGSPQPCLANTAVTLRGATEVQRTTVKLSDIFNGVPAEIDRDIAQAPAPGKQVVYDVNVLNRVADKYRLDWQPTSSSDHAVITTACTRITADTIREAVIRKVKADGASGLQKGSEIDVSFDNHALEIDLPTDQGPDFTLNNFNYDPLGKHFRTDLVAETASGPFSVPISGRITVKRSIPVLTHRLEGGTTIGAADLDWMAVPEDRVNATVIVDADQLVGRELRRDTEEGEILHSHDVMPPRLVVRGSLVTMKIETPMMLVTAQGKALQDGTQGDVIRVTNTQSNRMVEGIVTGPGVVLIRTAEKIAEAE